MVAHFGRSHRLHDKAEARAKADEFRRASGKRFWSCGFCVYLFDSFIDRLRHLRSHFEQESSTPDQWHLTNVIKGLLLQEGVAQAWAQLLTARWNWYPPDASWQDPTCISLLIHMLQMGVSGEQSAEILAEAAFARSNLNEDPTNFMLESATDNNFDDPALLSEFSTYPSGMQQ